MQLEITHSLEFTIEVGGSELAFLDTVVSIKYSNFETWVYRKKTHTGVLLNYSALCPPQWKAGLIKCLLHRAWMICSTYERLHNEIQNLRSMFCENGYCVALFDNIVKGYLESKFCANQVKSEKVCDKDKC